MDYSQTVYDYIKAEETAFKTTLVALTDNWEWNMYDHVSLTVLYKNSTYKDGKDENKPFKNITRPLLNLQYRSEGFDVKDVIIFVDDPDNYYKSFLVKKFHDKWARENDIDTFIDEIVESFVDFGGALIKNVNKKRPEVVPFQRIAFCDQTDILSGPLCEKHYYSSDQLRDMVKQGWDADAIEEVIEQSQNERRNTTQTTGGKTKTPGKYIEVYELHGMLPDFWLDKEDPTPGDKVEFVRQLQIVTFYKDANGQKNGITLFSGKEKDEIYKFIARDKIYGRALGLGGAEELFEAQVWTNYDVIRMKDMLDTVAKIIFQTTDPGIASRNKTLNMENGEIIVTAPNTRIDPVNIPGVNIALFERSISEWDEHAKEMTSAAPAIFGQAGGGSRTSFMALRLMTSEASALHEYRKGKLATFVGEVYRDWILPYISKEIAKGKTFLSALSVEELQEVADNVATNKANDFIKEKILNGETINPDEVAQYQQQAKAQFMKGGNKRFIQILEGELKSVPTDVEVSIAGKQKDLSTVVDQLTRIFQQVLAAPQVLDDPRMAKIFNKILEAGGMSPIDFYMPPDKSQQNGQSGKVAESISFKDLPPDGKVQMAKQAGINIQPPTQQPAVVGAGNQPPLTNG